MARQRPPPDHVVCRHCENEYRAITVSHLRTKHGCPGDHPVLTYKQSFDLAFAMCRQSRKKISRARVRFLTKTGQHWTRDRVIAQIQRRHRAGRSLRRRRVPAALYDAARRLFGTWAAAVQQAGLNYEVVTGVRRWTPARVIERIQELAALGVPLSRKHIEAHYYALYRAAIRRFPRSWSKALWAAGFDPEQHKIRPERWDQPQAADWVRTRIATGQTIRACDAPSKLFQFVRQGLHLSWADFLDSLDIANHGIQRKRQWTKTLVVAEIRRLNADGQRLNSQAVAQADQSLLVQARKFFGSWDQARAAARV